MTIVAWSMFAAAFVCGLASMWLPRWRVALDCAAAAWAVVTVPAALVARIGDLLFIAVLYAVLFTADAMRTGRDRDRRRRRPPSPNGRPPK